MGVPKGTVRMKAMSKTSLTHRKEYPMIKNIQDALLLFAAGQDARNGMLNPGILEFVGKTAR